MHKSRVTPALVVACVALVVSLGGTTYAAVTLPAGSVGARQLQTDAVTSAKVKNGSLRRVDFPPSIFSGSSIVGPKGDNGDKGDKGAKGDTGDKGAKGDKGASGTSDAYVDSVIGGPITVGVTTRLASLRITDPGKYVIWSKLTLFGDATYGTLTTCTLAAENETDRHVASLDRSKSDSIAGLVTHEFTSAGTINLTCEAGTGGNTSSAYDIRIVAIKVSSITASTG